MKELKKRVRRAKRKASTLITIWQTFSAAVLFIIILPVFLATHEHDSFYAIMIIGTLALILLLFGLEAAFRKRAAFGSYVAKSRWHLTAAAAALGGAAIMPGATFATRMLLLVSAVFYAAGGRRIGLGFMLGGL